VNSEIWVQDGTGGIAVFSVLSTSTLALGDRVEVTGTLGAFSGQLQIQTNPVVTFKAAGQAPAPVQVTGTQFNALASEGRLVQLPITITTVPGGAGAAFTVTGTAADAQVVQIRVSGLNTGLTRASFAVGTTYTVTGVLSQFNGTGQIKPRFASDVTQ
jgi:DNA/RNA endonuclease YhcR with UshA esterase domain